MNTLADIFDGIPAGGAAVVVPGGGPTLSYKDLADDVERVAEVLAAAGVRRGRAVSIALPNGAHFLTVFLAVARAGAIAAPLNPAYTEDEFAFYMQDADAQLAVVQRGGNPARRAADGLNIPALDATLDAKGKTILWRDGVSLTARKDAEPPSADDVALFLHTSGTTSRPKGVPLTHGNLAASLENIGDTYALAPDDAAMVVMPLFHVHGLIGVALSTLRTGGRAVVPDRFSASRFWDVQRETGATWYSAVPTIHQILLMRADDDAAPRESFRFIRSCSAALAPSVFADLENRFGAPVLEAYGMTEAAHQMASHPLPPGARRPGTVGRGTGVDIGVMDEAGATLAAGETGEVVIRGANVTLGYHNNPAANAESFSNGWFRTGDQGVLDADGTLTLTGRIKELINRGGEKISPLEVDAALLRHPAVAEAVCFGMPDAKYGETVHAAVTLSAACSEDDIRAFCGESLAEFKVPDRVHVIETLPRTATGKIQRRHIAAMFGE